MTSGFDDTASAVALAKQYIGMCGGNKDITLPEQSLKLMLTAFVGLWMGEQDRKRADYKKVAG